MRIAAAQTADYRNDIPSALAALHEFSRQAEAAGATLLCFPEGYLQGYVTEEVAARQVALDLQSTAFADLLDRLPARGPVLVVGLIEAEGDQLFNTAIVARGGRLLGRYRKTHLLPGERAFTPGDGPRVFEVESLRFGVNICFDTNFPEAARAVADLGARLLVCPANNMLRREAARRWKEAHNAIRGERCRETGLWLLSSDVAGERDGRVAWGPTAVLNPHGEVAAQLPLGAPGLLVHDLRA